MKTYIVQIGLISMFFSIDLQAQSAWTHVGPISSNVTADNKFETSQLNVVKIDPLNPNHLFAGGIYAGLWESVDTGMNWTVVEASDHIGSNGISAIHFYNNREIIISDCIQIGRVEGGASRDRSTGIWKYNFISKQWTTFSSIPSTVPLFICELSVLPGNPALLFAATTVGLFKSVDNGISWANVSMGYVSSIVHSEINGTFITFIAGSKTAGNYRVPSSTMMVKMSTDLGSSFTDLSQHFSTGYQYSHTKICATPVLPNGEINFYLYSLGSPKFDTTTEVGGTYIHKFAINTHTANLIFPLNTNLFPNEMGTQYGTHARMAITYDHINNALWFGGVHLSFLDLDSGTLHPYVKASKHTGNGYIHDDIHHIIMNNSDMYIAHDGGIAYASIVNFGEINPNTGTTVYFINKNKGINVNLINGFSGTDDDPNLYVIGGQDIVNTEIYDAEIGKNRYTIPTWENDGGLIDRNDKRHIIFDRSSYNSYYSSTINGGSTYTGEKTFYLPSNSEFTSSDIVTNGVLGFVSRQFYQDPYRQDRIFHVKALTGIYQYVKDDNNDNKSVFVQKVWPGGIDPYQGTAGSFGTQAWAVVSAMSFSQQTVNGLYFTINGGNHEGQLSRPSVIRYIGKNIEDCWRDHNLTFYTKNGSTLPQWESITPASMWSKLGVTMAEQEKVEFHSIETSPWNSDITYVGLYVPGHPNLKVLKFNGSTWEDYSQGLPYNEIGFSMIMDKESFDGIYLSTEKGVYYRSGFGSYWEYYSNGLPKLKSVQMEINYAENTVRTGTYGRGIWKSNLYCPKSAYNVSNCENCNVDPFFWEGTKVNISSTTLSTGKRIIRGAETIELLPGSGYTLLTPNGNSNNFYFAFIHGCNPDLLNSYKSASAPLVEEEEFEATELLSLTEKGNEITVKLYPNPNEGVFKFSINDDNLYDIYIYNSIGTVIKELSNTKAQEVEIDISAFPPGLFILKCQNGTSMKTVHFVKR